MARYQHACCRPGEDEAGKAISDLIHAYYIRVSQESPVRMLTENAGSS